MGWALPAAGGSRAKQPLQSLPVMDISGRPLLKRWVQCVLQNHFFFNWKFNNFFPKYSYCLAKNGV